MFPAAEPGVPTAEPGVPVPPADAGEAEDGGDVPATNLAAAAEAAMAAASADPADSFPSCC